MKKPEVEALFPLIGSKATEYRGPWVQGPCALAPWRHDDGVDRHPSFGIKSEENKKSLVKCFSCGFGGGLMDLVVELGWRLKDAPTEIKGRYDLAKALDLVANENATIEFDANIPDYGEKPEDEGYVIYPDKWLQSFKSALLFPAAIKYWTSRGLPKMLMKELDIRYDPIRHRVCFPFRDFNNRLCGVQGRRINDHGDLGPRYYFYPYKGSTNNRVWLGEHRLNLDQTVVVVEGPFDYASVNRVYRNVCASFSAGIGARKIERLADAIEIVSFYDFGKGGDQARKALTKYLPGTPIAHVVPPDAEYDPGKMTTDMLVQHLGPHLNLTIPS